MSSSASTDHDAVIGSTPGALPSAAAPARRRPRPIFLVVGVVLAVVLAVGLFSSVLSMPGSGAPGPGSAVPTFSLPQLAGSGRVGVPEDGGGAGRPAILLFFASWCTPCQKEIPAIAATYRTQQATHSRLAGVRLVGVDGNDPTASAVAFLRSSGVTFPVGADRTYRVTENLFSFTALPESVFVTAGGAIAGIHYGALSTAILVRWQRQLLAIR